MSASRKSPCLPAGLSRLSSNRRSMMPSKMLKALSRDLPVWRRKPCKSSCRRKGKKSETLGLETNSTMPSIRCCSPSADSEPTSAMSTEKKQLDMRLRMPLCSTSPKTISSPACARK
uniref:Uncharacterized protein n=1 Tax=Oryza brachyantha TaxID=4533 RepID=J3LE11_ORYBR